MFIKKFLRWGALTTISMSLIACQSSNEQATTKSVTTVPLTLERIYKRVNLAHSGLDKFVG